MNKYIKFCIILLLLIAIIYLYNTYFNNNLLSRKNIEKNLEKISTDIIQNNTTKIFIIDNYLPDNECNIIINELKDILVPSPLTRPQYKFRTSKTAYFTNTSNQNNIDQKILSTMKINNKYGEIPQLQYYDIGDEFKAHCDWFDSRLDKDFYDKGQRTWTFMIYLNNVIDGGETHFTKLNKSIKPKKGRAVIWYNLNDDNSPNHDTMHRGSPINSGEKYIITKWFKFDKN